MYTVADMATVSLVPKITITTFEITVRNEGQHAHCTKLYLQLNKIYICALVTIHTCISTNGLHSRMLLLFSTHRRLLPIMSEQSPTNLFISRKYSMFLQRTKRHSWKYSDSSADHRTNVCHSEYLGHLL